MQRATRHVKRLTDYYGPQPQAHAGVRIVCHTATHAPAKPLVPTYGPGCKQGKRPLFAPTSPMCASELAFGGALGSRMPPAVRCGAGAKRGTQNGRTD